MHWHLRSSEGRTRSSSSAEVKSSRRSSQDASEFISRLSKGISRGIRTFRSACWTLRPGCWSTKNVGLLTHETRSPRGIGFSRDGTRSSEAIQAARVAAHVIDLHMNHDNRLDRIIAEGRAL